MIEMDIIIDGSIFYALKITTSYLLVILNYFNQHFCSYLVIHIIMKVVYLIN